MLLRRDALPWCVSLVLSCAGCQGEQEPQEDAVAAVAQGLTQADCPAGYTVIVGTNNADTLNGSAGNDCIVGLGGNDVIHGNGGNDFLIGGNGNDQLFGDDGNDQLFGEAGDDALQGGNGNDTISGEGGTDTIGGGAGNDTITGGTIGDIINGDDGDDTISGEGGDDTINGGVGNDAIWGGDGVDTVHGNDGADRIFGESGNDQLYGDIGNDVIDGGANADTIRGGDGDDVIDGDLANDTLYGENGEDVLIGGAGTNTSDGGPGTDACSGVSCELPAMTPSGCTQDSQCSSGKHCIVDIGLCLGCLADADNDGVCNSADGCPNDAAKSAPGICGCGVSDADSDGDGTASCNDGCPSDANKTAAGICGCGVSDADSDHDGTANCNDGCPSDANKVAPGICGCGVSDTDSDGDGTASCNDGCPNDVNKIAAGICGCGVSDADSDGDGTASCNDGCPSDANKFAAGICGCGVSDADSDGDGTASCNDGCPSDANKIAAGLCGCGVSDADSDGDVVPDCNDGCPSDPNKWQVGVCGCGVSDVDSDFDGTPNCNDGCPSDPNKTAEGVCGCNASEVDSDSDGTPNCHDECPSDPAKVLFGFCGCGFSEADADLDGTPDCADLCPSDPSKLEPGICGCSFADEDSDGDTVLDCFDGCPQDPNKLEPLACGCGVAESGDTDLDGTPDCNDGCADDPNKTDQGACGCGVADVDTDYDGLLDCQDACPTGDNDQDSDHDSTPDGCDLCPGHDDSIDGDNDGAPDGCPLLVVANRNALPSYSADLANFDEDCDVDAVIGGEQALQHWSNDGSGALSANSPTSVLGDYMNVAAGDLDGDGHADVAIRRSNWSDTTLSVAYGDGAGGFVEQGTPLDDGAPYAEIRLADVTGDGVLDAVTVGESSLVVAVGATPPARGFVETISGPPLLGPGWAVKFATGDLDFDGDDEVLVIDGEEHCSLGCSREHDLFVYDFEAPGALAREQLGRLSNGGEVYSMVLGDVVGDPALDLVLVDTPCGWPNSCGTRLTVYSGVAPDSGMDTWLSGEHARFAGSGAIDVDSSMRIVLADLWGDNKLEIVAAGYTSTKVYRANALTPFDTVLIDVAQSFDVGASDYAHVADLDGDGALDLLIRGNTGGWQWWRGVWPYKRVGPDRDNDDVCDIRDACPNGSNTLDQDGDGIPEGCDACSDDPGNDPDHDGVCALEDSCPQGHNFADDDGDGMPNACDDCPVDPAGNDDQDGDGVCDTGDLCPGADDTVDQDQDGVPDGCPALMLGPTTDNAKTGQWGGRASTAGDFDQDCHPDVVLVSADESSRFAELWTGDGAGHFQYSRQVDPFPDQLQIVGVNSGDVDNDGKLDVVAWTNYSFETNNSEIAVWHGAGSAGFDDEHVSAPASYGYDVQLGYVDGDDKLDAVYAYGSRVRVRFGAQYYPSFEPQEMLGPNLDPVNNANMPFALADVDGDGEQEILVMGYGPGQLYVLNRGQGLEATALTGNPTPSGFGFAWLMADDFDRDGRVDLLGGSFLPWYWCPQSSDQNDCGLVQVFWGVDPAQSATLWSPDVAFEIGGSIYTSLPIEMKAVDLVGDDRPEVVTFGMNHVNVIGFYGDSPWGGPALLQTFKQRGNGISTVDVNSDGATDVIVSGYDGLHTYLSVDPSKRVGSSCP